MARLDGAIGIFDSGVGGLSVAREIRALLPSESMIYVGDQANVPYGPRSAEQIIQFSSGITQLLIEEGAKIIVVACNTASGAALSSLRANFPRISFIGMEPAIKPASEKTRSGVIGVLATPNTFAGELYHRTLQRFAGDKHVIEDPCVGLVERIEAGELDRGATQEILTSALEPMLAAGVDSIVMGCTHYPFVMPLIRQIVGDKIELINPAPAVARQTQAVLTREGTLAKQMDAIAKIELLTSGDVDRFSATIKKISPEIYSEAEIGNVVWRSEKLYRGRSASS